MRFPPFYLLFCSLMTSVVYINVTQKYVIAKGYYVVNSENLLEQNGQMAGGECKEVYWRGRRITTQGRCGVQWAISHPHKQVLIREFCGGHGILPVNCFCEFFFFFFPHNPHVY